jgi:hypothetical protein
MTDGVAIPPSYGPREILPAEHYAGNAWGALKLDGGQPNEIALAYEKMLVDQRDAAMRAALKLIEDPGMRPLLEFLTDITLRRPVVLGLTKEARLLAHEREGANRVVWLIYQMIAQARGEMPPYREGT